MKVCRPSTAFMVGSSCDGGTSSTAKSPADRGVTANWKLLSAMYRSMIRIQELRISANWSLCDRAENSGIDLANWTILTTQSVTRALTGARFFLASWTLVFPVTGVLGKESETGESHALSDVRFGVE